MISIKKVEVTPIDRNYASVVDSTATQDDKTKNTYSMRVIDSQLGSKANTSDVYVKNDFAVITGSMTGDGTTSLTTDITYPSGFDNTNCVVISSMLQHSNTQTGSWGTGSVFDSSSYVSGSLPHRVVINNTKIVIEARNIQIQNGQSPLTPEFSSSITFNYKIVLMKIS